MFISYARANTEMAQRIAEATRALGYGVWRDDELPAHRSYAEVIEERLKAAKAVVVVWSAAAAKSEWVQSEADLARGNHKLVQLTLDGTALPMPFDRIQCADMAGWNGDLDAAGWKKVAASIAELVERGSLAAAVEIKAPEALSDVPSIAVLPFANLSGDPEQDYFAEGMVEEIVAALSRFKSIFVSAAGSGLVFKGQPVTPAEAAHRLGVRYLLGGSVRKAGGRVRIAVHLIDASDGQQIWADRLEDTLEDVFALQDQVALRVAGVVETTIQEIDIRRAARRPTENAGSYDAYLRSISLFLTFRRDEVLKSIELLDQAIALDPNFETALSQSGVCHRLVIEHGWCDDPEGYRKRGLELIERALSTGGQDARILAQAAAGLTGLDPSPDRAIVLVDRAIAMNPASSFVWLISGTLRLRAGESDIAAEHLETTIRLDPISHMNATARMYLAMARFQQGRFDEALALFRTTSIRIPVSHAVLAALHGYLRQPTEARAALAEFDSLDAGGIKCIADLWFHRPEHRKLFLDGIAFAEEPAPAAAG